MSEPCDVLPGQGLSGFLVLCRHGRREWPLPYALFRERGDAERYMDKVLTALRSRAMYREMMILEWKDGEPMALGHYTNGRWTPSGTTSGPNPSKN